MFVPLTLSLEVHPTVLLPLTQPRSIINTKQMVCLTCLRRVASDAAATLRRAWRPIGLHTILTERRAGIRHPLSRALRAGQMSSLRCATPGLTLPCHAADA